MVLVVGAGVSAWLVFGGSSVSSTTPSPSASATGGDHPTAQRRDAVRFARDFAQARVNHRPVNAFVAKAVAARYGKNAGGLDLYEYDGSGGPAEDIVGYSLFHVEKLRYGHFLVAFDFKLAGNGVREEDVIIGPGTDALGRPADLVVLKAQLRGS